MSRNPLTQCSKFIQIFLEKSFGGIGRIVGNHPWAAIIISSIISLAFLGGFFTNWTPENRVNKLWIPQDVQAIKDEEWVSATFGYESRTFEIYLKPSANENVLQRQYLVQYLIAHNKLTSIKAKSTEYQNLFPDTYSWDGIDNTTTICLVEGNECSKTTILDIVGYNETIINSLTISQILLMVNNQTLTTGIELDDIFGGIERNINNEIISVSILRGVYKLSAAGIDIDNNFVDPSRESWENEVINQLNFKYQWPSNTKVLAYGSVAFSNEFGAAIGGDGALYGGGCMLLIFYAAIALGKRDYVHSMVGLALASILTVGLAVVGSFGFAGYIGLIFTPFSSTLPFLILGLGVDDAFIIAGEYQSQKKLRPNISIAKRLELTMAHAGVSIFITSLTDTVAFGIGASTALPALQSFCLYATIGVIFVFFLNITFFAGCVVLDQQRAESNRMDCCCFYKFKEKHYMFPEIESPNDKDIIKHKYCCACEKIPAEISRKSFGSFAKCLNKTWSKVVVFTIALGVLGFSIYGTLQLEQDFKLEWFIPDDSYLQEYYQWRDDYFSGGSTPIFIYSKNLNYIDYKTELLSANNLLETASYLEGNVFDWHKPFISYTEMNNITLTTSNYYTTLYTYLNTPIFLGGGNIYANLIEWNDKNDITKGLKGAFMIGSYKSEQVINAQKQVDAMNLIRNDAKKLFNFNQIFPFTFAFLFWEQYSVIGDELWRNLAIAIIVIFVIALVLIPKISAALLVLICVLMTLTDVLGFMWLWGLNIDAVTVCYTVIAIGLAVDYSAHVGEAFMLSHKKTNHERLIDSMSRMGASVFNGAFSTFLAVLALSLSKTYIFRVFFQQFFLVTILGAAHGLIVLPALLSSFGPSSIKGLEHETEPEPIEPVANESNVTLKTNMENEIQMGVASETGTAMNDNETIATSNQENEV